MGRREEFAYEYIRGGANTTSTYLYLYLTPEGKAGSVNYSQIMLRGTSTHLTVNSYLRAGQARYLEECTEWTQGLYPARRVGKHCQ